MTDFTLHVYDTQGKLLNELQSPLVRHIPQNNTNWLKNPHIIMTENNQSEWRIDAEEATTKNGGEEIVFNKRVVIKQLSNKQSVQSTFKTDSLTYFPQKKFATTTDHITFIQPGHVVKAKGMNAYLAEKRIQLLSHTRGIYEPTKH